MSAPRRVSSILFVLTGMVLAAAALPTAADEIAATAGEPDAAQPWWALFSDSDVWPKFTVKLEVKATAREAEEPSSMSAAAADGLVPGEPAAEILQIMKHVGSQVLDRPLFEGAYEGQYRHAFPQREAAPDEFPELPDTGLLPTNSLELRQTMIDKIRQLDAAGQDESHAYSPPTAMASTAQRGATVFARMRGAALALDEAAIDMEKQGRYEEADDLRLTAQELRQRAAQYVGTDSWAVIPRPVFLDPEHFDFDIVDYEQFLPAADKVRPADRKKAPRSNVRTARRPLRRWLGRR